MPRSLTTFIPDSDCIGDSLNTINNNYLKLDEECQDINTRAAAASASLIMTLSGVNVVDSPTVDLTWNTTTRGLTANVIDNSIDYTKVASGMVLNCVNTFYNEASSYNSVALTDIEINALNTTITPKLTTSKILIQIMLNGEAHNDAVFRLKRVIGETATDIGLASTTSSGNRNTGIAPMQYDYDNASTMNNMFIQHLDSPQTISPVTYKLYYRADTSNRSFSLNRTTSDNNASNYERASSSVNLLEIKG